MAGEGRIFFHMPDEIPLQVNVALADKLIAQDVGKGDMIATSSVKVDEICTGV